MEAFLRYNDSNRHHWWKPADHAVTEVMKGRFDASYGLLLKGNKNKIFKATVPKESSFIMSGDCRDQKNHKHTRFKKTGNWFH